MKNLDLIAEELFNKIRGRFPSVTIGDGEGKVTNKPNEARYYDFDYTEGSTKLGRVSISLTDSAVEVMYSNDFVANEDVITRENWYSFLKELRAFSKKRLLNFDTRNINKSNLDQRDYKFLATNRTGDGTMTESKMYGTSKTSYQNVGEARIAIKHSKPVNVESVTGRIQNISAIYVESPEGERFKYPFKHLNGARAMARHVAEGGKPYDDFGSHITGLSEELASLKKFKSYMNRSSVMAEGLSGYVLPVNERLEEIKKTISSLQKESTYRTAFESFEKPVLEDVPSDVAENWIDQLTIKQFNEELKDVFPYVYRLVSEVTKAKTITAEDLLGEGFFGRLMANSVEDWAEEYPEGALGDASRAFVAMRQQYKGTEWEAQVECRIATFEDFVNIKERMPMGPNGRPIMPEEPSAWLEINGNHKCAIAGNNESFEDTLEQSFEEMMGQFGSKSVAIDEESIDQHVVQDLGNGFKTVKVDAFGQTDLIALHDTQSGTFMLPNKGYVRSPGKYIIIKDGQMTTTMKLGPQTQAAWKAGNLGESIKEAANDCDETCPKSCPDCGGTGDPEKYQAMKKDEGNAYAQAVRQAKMNGKKKGDKIDGPDGKEITLEKQIPVTEFILSMYDRETGQFPKGETAVLTAVEKDYGEQFINPAKAFIEAINAKFEEFNGYRDPELMDDITDESALQAHIGRKKYGKDGMAALAQAGRDGASEEELGRIKDKYKQESEDLRRLAGL